MRTARAGAVRDRGHVHARPRHASTIRDDGRWRPPRGANRGRGLPLMRALMEHVDVQHTDKGTTVVLERAIGQADAA